jgi:hypothetical protein
MMPFEFAHVSLWGFAFAGASSPAGGSGGTGGAGGTGGKGAHG